MISVDNVINEFFKHCFNDCIQIIVYFLNIVLNTGFIPTEWCIGIILLLGSVSDPDNYNNNNNIYLKSNIQCT